jgi:hypothetical protein
VIATVGISNASKPLVRAATLAIRSARAARSWDVLDGGHCAGALDAGPDARVVLAAASLQQRLVPSISLDRRKPATGIYRRKLRQFAEWQINDGMQVA